MKINVKRETLKVWAVILIFALIAQLNFQSYKLKASAEAAPPVDTAGYAGEYMDKFFEGGKNRQRLTGTEEARASARWIAAEFAELGLKSAVAKTKETDEDFIKRFEITSAGTLLQQGATVDAYNVAGFFNAGGAALKTVVIGANYDNLYGQQYSQGYTNKSEGVLDNASGVCAMLAVAKAVAKNAENGILPQFNIIFAAFGANNDGLRGSYDFVSDTAAYKGDLPGLSSSDISLMVNLSCVAGGDKLYLYCDEVDTLHQNLIKKVADGQNNFYQLNLPPQNKKIVLDGSPPLGYMHKGLSGDHYYFWYNEINVAYFFGYNWDINELGNTESAAGTVAGTENDVYGKLNNFYPDGAKMADSAVNIVTGVIYDAGAAEAFSGSQSQKYDYRSFWGNALYPFIFRIAAVGALCLLFALLYIKGRKNTPKEIMRKYTAKVAVFGDEYENVPPQGPQDPFAPQEPRNPYPPNGF